MAPHQALRPRTGISRYAGPVPQRSSLEYRVGACAMVNGAFNFSPAAIDLALQQADARLELGKRQAIEILVDQRGQGIVGPGPQDIVQVHIAER